MNVQGGQIGNQTNGNPIGPGTTWQGPLLSGYVLESDGSGNLSGVGSTVGTSDVGYAVMAQTGVITQAANTTSTVIVIPYQSQILRITAMVTTAWTGNSTTFGIGSSGNTTYFTAAGAGNGSTRGPIVFSPGSLASAIANWDNVGNTSVQVTATSTNTGSGVATLTVEYVAGIFNAS